MRSHYVDLHCHLDLYPDFASAVQDAERAGVYTLTVTTTPKAWPRNREVTETTHYVRAALGLHPQLVGERADEISLWDQYFSEARYIGEVGVDAGPRYYRSLDLQKEVFQHVLQRCAITRNKILSVHSVRSTKIVLDLIEQYLPPTSSTVVLHWFTGSMSETRRAIELGCYFSVNVQMMLNEKGRRLTASLPADRVLTETDGPFTQANARAACPADVSQAVEAIAECRNSSIEQVKFDITQNLKTLLKHDPFDQTTQSKTSDGQELGKD
jgi:TatD DNase family protein